MSSAFARDISISDTIYRGKGIIPVVLRNGFHLCQQCLLVRAGPPTLTKFFIDDIEQHTQLEGEESL